MVLEVWLSHLRRAGFHARVGYMFNFPSTHWLGSRDIRGLGRGARMKPSMYLRDGYRWECQPALGVRRSWIRIIWCWSTGLKSGQITRLPCDSIASRYVLVSTCRVIPTLCWACRGMGMHLVRDFSSFRYLVNSTGQRVSFRALCPYVLQTRHGRAPV